MFFCVKKSTSEWVSSQCRRTERPSRYLLLHNGLKIVGEKSNLIFFTWVNSSFLINIAGAPYKVKPPRPQCCAVWNITLPILVWWTCLAALPDIEHSYHRVYLHGKRETCHFRLWQPGFDSKVRNWHQNFILLCLIKNEWNKKCPRCFCTNRFVGMQGRYKFRSLDQSFALFFIYFVNIQLQKIRICFSRSYLTPI